MPHEGRRRQRHGGRHLLLQRLLHRLQGRGGGEPGARGGDRDRRRGCYVPQHIVLLLSVYDGQILEMSHFKIMYPSTFDYSFLL